MEDGHWDDITMFIVIKTFVGGSTLCKRAGRSVRLYSDVRYRVKVR